MRMSDRPGTVVFAYSEVGHRCLKTLMDLGADIRGVLTYEDDRSENTWFKSVKELALAAGFPSLLPPAPVTLPWWNSSRA